MTEHEHTRVIHMVHIELPFGLTPSDVAIEETATLPDYRYLVHQLASEFGELELQRVITAAAALIQRHSHRKLADCLFTAMVWERG